MRFSQLPLWARVFVLTLYTAVMIGVVLGMKVIVGAISLRAQEFVLTAGIAFALGGSTEAWLARRRAKKHGRSDPRGSGNQVLDE